ncbi:MAG: hypothetical protein LKI99_05985 [Acetobacter fabarum]|jgi:hypothetical protein|nr:hypothetical protein [Acetobacter fabarum]MCI1909245.1 hypothetical protein [Acetobacter fabarum]MCI1927223.1 hypothetical protein [Acetobacter fabarum]MCI1947223.1 hypothetical protein [Acetobacter fabarum]MCI1988523.1 hypothetical protein [Acetobacter fabarum]
MTQKPTGVFVRFPLTEAQVSAYSDARAKAWVEQGKPTTTSTFEAALLAIGAHVHGEGIPVVGTIHIGENGKPFFTAPELYSTGGDVVLHSEAQAQIAARDAEIVQKDAKIHEYRMLLEQIINKASLSCVRTLSGRESRLLAGACADAREALKGGAA